MSLEQVLRFVMSGITVNTDAAASVGIDPRRIVLLAFVLAAALGALGGVLIAPITTTSYQVGLLMALKGFAAAIVGGMMIASTARANRGAAAQGPWPRLAGCSGGRGSSRWSQRPRLAPIAAGVV